MEPKPEPESEPRPRFINLFTDANIPLKMRKNDVQKFIEQSPLKIKSPGNVYKLLKYLSSGTYGDVFSAIDKEGRKFAIKITDLGDSNLREVSYTQQMQKHCREFIVNLEEAFKYEIKESKTNWLVQIQELTLGDINNVPLNYNKICDLLVFLLRAANCLHKNGIAHLDIRQSNILYTENCFKLADFGLACTDTDNPYAGCKLRATYIPPSLVNRVFNSDISFKEAQKIDLWAIGVTIYIEMAKKKHLYDSRTYLRLNDLNYVYLENLDPVMRNYIVEKVKTIDLEFKKNIKNPKIPLDVFKHVMELLLDNKYTPASDILRYLTEAVDLSKFKNC